MSGPDRLGGGTTFTTPSDREIVVTRVLDAPRRLVFDAWTSPEHLPHWMGRRDWTMRVCEIDLRPGGGYRFVWSGPGGGELTISGMYRVIAPPERLVTTETWEGRPDVLNTLVLTEHDGVTTMTCTMLYPSREIRDAMLGTDMRAGMSEGFDRLEDRLRARA
ncbi:ATPase [Sphaerisporangium album]|uniref:ATPase n=1 Tax=Sphaerisporangium album TaxID=509200 RepID=A0A367FE98_9ACTN|nr:SRPBCC family protein [Sphaerisporangium album]RCG28601.1 ATPase [Sphaerisporangium album]